MAIYTIEAILFIFQIVSIFVALLDKIAARLGASASRIMLTAARSAHGVVPAAPIADNQKERDAGIPAEPTLASEFLAPSNSGKEIQEEARAADPKIIPSAATVTAAKTASNVNEPSDSDREADDDSMVLDKSRVHDSSSTLPTDPTEGFSSDAATSSHELRSTSAIKPSGGFSNTASDGEMVAPEIELGPANDDGKVVFNGAQPLSSNVFNSFKPATSDIKFSPNCLDQSSAAPRSVTSFPSTSFKSTIAATTSVSPSSARSIVSIATDTKPRPAIDSAIPTPLKRPRRSPSASSTTSTHSSNASSTTMTYDTSDSENVNRQIKVATPLLTLLQDYCSTPSSVSHVTSDSSSSTATTPARVQDPTETYTLITGSLYAGMVLNRIRYTIATAPTTNSASEAAVGSAAAESGHVRAYRPNLYQVASLVQEERKITDGKQSGETNGDGFDDLVRQHEMFHKKREQRAAQRNSPKKKNVKNRKIKKNRSHRNEPQMFTKPSALRMAPTKTHNANSIQEGVAVQLSEAVHSDDLLSKQHRKSSGESHDNKPRLSTESKATQAAPTEVDQPEEILSPGDADHMRPVMSTVQNHEPRGDEARAGNNEGVEQSVPAVGRDMAKNTVAIEPVSWASLFGSPEPSDESKLSDDNTAQVTTCSDDVRSGPCADPLPVDARVQCDCDPGDASQDLCSIATGSEHEATVKPSTYEAADVNALPLDAAVASFDRDAAEPVPSEHDSPGSSTGSSATSSTSVPFDLEAHVHHLLTRSLQKQQREVVEDPRFLPPHDYGPWIHEELESYLPMGYRDNLYSYPEHMPEGCSPQHQYDGSSQLQYHEPQHPEMQYHQADPARYNGSMAMSHGPPPFNPSKPWSAGIPFATAMDRGPPPFIASKTWPAGLGLYHSKPARRFGPGSEVAPPSFCSSEPNADAIDALAARPFADYWETRCWGRNGYVNRLNMKPWYLQPLVYEMDKQRGRNFRDESKEEQQRRVFRRYGL